jgi:ribosomal protein S18 acetylase RimI-like enzyme
MPTDAPILGQYFLGLSEQTKAYFGPHPFDQATASRLCATDYTNTIRMIATIGGGDAETVVAYMIFILGVRDAELERFRQAGISLDSETVCTIAPSVADAYQDQGLGSRLMLHLIHIARRLGNERMVLFGGVYATNQRAIHFYEKHGFRTVGAFARVDGRISYNMLIEL